MAKEPAPLALDEDTARLLAEVGELVIDGKLVTAPAAEPEAAAPQEEG